jgi:uncharacterized membrane protein (DUF4010 family)
MSSQDTLLNLGLALALGLLVGLDRERVPHNVAGLRTFGCIAVAGALSALVAGMQPDVGVGQGAWIVAAALLSTAALVVSARAGQGDRPPERAGVTTEVATVVTFLVGVLCVTGPRAGAVVVAGALYILLHAKRPMRRFVRALTAKDLTAIAQFVLVGLVILPVLPDQGFGPYEVLNPRRIWWMVLLVVSLSLGAYVVYTVGGSRIGTPVAGILGGLISTTATTVTHARLARQPGREAASAAVILLASAVLYVRLLVLVAVAAPAILRVAAGPIATVGAAAAAVAIVAWVRMPRRRAALPDQRNPAQLLSAISFGAIYAAVLLVVAFAQDRLGTAGVYATSALGGLADLDAVTLSNAQLATAGSLGAAAAWKAIVLATIANGVTKVGIVLALGSRGLAFRVVPAFLVVFAVSGTVLWLWPDFGHSPEGQAAGAP